MNTGNGSHETFVLRKGGGTSQLGGTKVFSQAPSAGTKQNSVLPAVQNPEPQIYVANPCTSPDQNLFFLGSLPWNKSSVSTTHLTDKPLSLFLFLILPKLPNSNHSPAEYIQLYTIIQILFMWIISKVFPLQMLQEVQFIPQNRQWTLTRPPQPSTSLLTTPAVLRSGISKLETWNRNVSFRPNPLQSWTHTLPPQSQFNECEDLEIQSKNIISLIKAFLVQRLFRISPFVTRESEDSEILIIFSSAF